MSSKNEDNFRNAILDILREKAIISIGKVKSIALKMKIDDYVAIMNQIISDNAIEKKFIINCPHCLGELGSFSKDLIGKKLTCVYCGNEFSIGKNNRNLFFSKNSWSMNSFNSICQ